MHEGIYTLRLLHEVAKKHIEESVLNCLNMTESTARVEAGKKPLFFAVAPRDQAKNSEIDSIETRVRNI